MNKIEPISSLIKPNRNEHTIQLMSLSTMAQKYIFKKQSLSDHKNQIYCKISRWVKKPKKVIVIYTKKKKNSVHLPTDPSNTKF